MQKFCSTKYEIYADHTEKIIDTIERATWTLTATQCFDKPLKRRKKKKNLKDQFVLNKYTIENKAKYSFLNCIK